ncbi:Flp family type IVb pilin [Parvibaculum sp.]|jgi:pilus assembly protein Flp/PilA|uniref:Flp family type IVb pilin n=1 Tax=Parvibaculum sp. TaxID=2024848 RepID=UPI001B25C946|nr:Flp family type IVb pilin [Parvibaculum sp.]MBO6633826.1 Flp family type IVb pilin [Parvibaculum sp.]MBO6676969.1 Flp family type IVb pilin [Parvibaculum sp.]MBO6685862.1 Flp family type IVb pilin [Parvibaculum sp.]MBO6904102.1 Flp family type IVb pilin [Parvibaculum sp.]
MRGTGKLARAFRSEESGATAVEYALIVAGISAVIIVIVGTTGTALNDSLFNKVATALVG